MSQCDAKCTICGEPVNCLDEGVGIFWFDHETGAGFFNNLPRLTVHPDNHRPRTGQELEHLGANYGFEDVGLLQQNQADPWEVWWYDG